MTFHFIARKEEYDFSTLEKMTSIKFFFRRIFVSVAKEDLSFSSLINVCLNNLYACWQSNRNISAGYEP